METSDTIDKENIYYLKGQLSYYTNHVSQFINIYSIYTEKVATVADKTKDRETVTAKLDPGTLTVYPKATAKTDNVFRVGGAVPEAADMINDKIKAALEDSSATVTYAWKTALSTDAANTYATGVITATYTFPDGTTRTVDVSVEAEVVDVSKLQELVDNAETVRQSPLYTEADDAEKAAYDKSIEEAQTILNDKTSRQTAVDTGVTNITNDAKTGSYDQLNGWTNLNQAKKDALDEVKADAELLQNNIGSGYLSEKLPEAIQTKYKDAIQAVVDQLAKDIEAAEGDDLSVETGGAQTIAKVEELKAEANAKIQLINYQAQLEAKKQDIADKINANTEATDEEKAAALKLLDAEYNEAAEKLINAAPSSVPETSSENADLKKIVDTSLNDDYLTPERKAAAKQVIEEVYASKQKELQNTPNATQEEIEAALAKLDEEKAAAIQAVDDALNKATNAIDNTSTIGGVDYYKEAGIDEINKIPTESTKKPAATAEIDKAAEDAKNTVDADSRLTDEEKQAAKEAIDKAAQAAKDAIDKDSTDAQVDVDTDAGKKEIESLIPTASAKKDAADAEIDKAAEDAKKAVDADTQLTDEEKQAAKDAIDKAAEDAKDAIDNATTNGAVDDATEAGKEAIKDLIPATSDKKDEAKAEIDKAAQDAKAEVDNNSYLSDDEKQAAKDAIDKAAQAAKDAIDASTTNAQVDAVTEAGKEAIKDLIPQKQAPSDEPVAPEVPEVPSDSDNSGDGGMVTPEAPSDSDADHSDNSGMEAPKAPATSSSSADAKGTQSSQAPSTANALVVGNGVGSSQATLPKTGQAEDRNLLAPGASMILGAFGLLAGRRKREDEE